MTQKVAILGAGSMGTACALILAENPETRVSMLTQDSESAALINSTRLNERYLPGVKIPESIFVSSEIDEVAADADYLFIAIPSKFLRAALTPLASRVPAGIPVISVVKGIEVDTFKRPSEIILDVLGPRPFVVLTGPSHAEELVQRLPAGLVAAAEDLNLARAVQKFASTDRFRIYTNPDVIGCELAGALKNVIGIAAGICDGLGFGDNAKSSIMARGISEISRFGVAFGALPETFSGLAGIGDLITTCMSRHGRNRYVGEQLGKGLSLETIQGSLRTVAEGVSTTKAVWQIAQQRGIDMPITEQIYRVLFEGLSALEATAALMQRPPGEE